jgi:hypothetical protein
MSNKPLLPRDWKTTKAITDAKKPFVVVYKTTRGKQFPAFNGSQTASKTKKRSITLPGEKKP